MTFFGDDQLNSLLSLQRGLERFFDRPLAGGWSVPSRGVFPPVNMFEQNDAVYVVVELPGMDRDRLDVEVQGDSLALRGERSTRPATEGGSYHRRERPYGTFRRVINLPYPVDAEKTRATYEDGILTVQLEKAEEAKPRRIAIQS